jgi:hypothetical protein
MSQREGSGGALLDADLPPEPDPFFREIEAAFSALSQLPEPKRSGAREGFGQVPDCEERERLVLDIEPARSRQVSARGDIRTQLENADQAIEWQMSPSADAELGKDDPLSLQDLTCLLVSQLEDARKLDSAVDPRHIVAQSSEGVRRRGRFHGDAGDAPPVEAISDCLRVLEALPVAGTGCGSLVPVNPTQETRAIRIHRQSARPCAPDPKDIASRISRSGSSEPLSGIRLDLSKSAASVNIPGRDGTLNLHNRRAALTLGFRKFGLSYRFQLTSSRIQALAPVAVERARLGPGPAICALVAAAVLLFGFPNFRTLLPESQRVSSAELASPTAPKRDNPQSQQRDKPLAPPRFSMVSPPAVDEKAPVIDPTQMAAPAQEHVVTRTTTNIRALPEQGAQIVRVVPGRLILNVFARNEEWIQVGGADAWGWVHSSFILPIAQRS